MRQLILSAIVLSLDMAQATTGANNPSVANAGGLSVPNSGSQTPASYPYYIGNGDMLIRDAQVSGKRPVHNTKIDYSQHGKNWEPKCTSYFEEQSPINLSWETAEANDLIQFEMLYQHSFNNATVVVDADGSVIRVDYPNKLDNDLRIFNERREEQLFHLSHMYWHTPSEHTIENRQMAAELQIFHIQYATNRQVAFSILFDKELALQMEENKLKTCFFQSFDFAGNAQSTAAGKKPSIIDVPLREFIDFMPKDKFVFYDGSETKPGCDEMVTWIVNMNPYVITEAQVSELRNLLAPDTRIGNYREIQKLGKDRTVYKFSNISDLLESGALVYGFIASLGSALILSI